MCLKKYNSLKYDVSSFINHNKQVTLWWRGGGSRCNFLIYFIKEEGKLKKNQRNRAHIVLESLNALFISSLKDCLASRAI